MTAFCRDSRHLYHRLRHSLSWLLTLQLLANAALPALLPPPAQAAPPAPAPLSDTSPAAPAASSPPPALEPLASQTVLTGTVFVPLILSEGAQTTETPDPAAAQTTTYLPLVSTGNAASDLDFSADPLSGPTPLTVTFSNRSADPGRTFTWDLGDGTVVSRTGVAVFSHTYLYAGSYDVVVTVDKLNSVLFG